MCQECTERSFVEHHPTSNSSAIDMWIQSDCCVICFPLVFSVKSLSVSTAIQTGTHVTQRGVQSEGLLYFCLVKCTLGPVFVAGNSWHPVTRQNLQDKAVLSWTAFELLSKAYTLNWPTMNLAEGQSFNISWLCWR